MHMHAHTNTQSVFRDSPLTSRDKPGYRCPPEAVCVCVCVCACVRERTHAESLYEDRKRNQKSADQNERAVQACFTTLHSNLSLSCLFSVVNLFLGILRVALTLLCL